MPSEPPLRRAYADEREPPPPSATRAKMSDADAAPTMRELRCRYAMPPPPMMRRRHYADAACRAAPMMPPMPRCADDADAAAAAAFDYAADTPIEPLRRAPAAAADDAYAICLSRLRRHATMPTPPSRRADDADDDAADDAKFITPSAERLRRCRRAPSRCRRAIAARHAADADISPPRRDIERHAERRRHDDAIADERAMTRRRRRDADERRAITPPLRRAAAAATPSADYAIDVYYDDAEFISTLFRRCLRR